MSKLKGCPFCAVEPTIRKGDLVTIWCFDCGFNIKGQNLRDAIERWNKRAPMAEEAKVAKKIMKGKA